MKIWWQHTHHLKLQWAKKPFIITCVGNCRSATLARALVDTSTIVARLFRLNGIFFPVQLLLFGAFLLCSSPINSFTAEHVPSVWISEFGGGTGLWSTPDAISPTALHVGSWGAGFKRTKWCAQTGRRGRHWFIQLFSHVVVVGSR